MGISASYRGLKCEKETPFACALDQLVCWWLSPRWQSQDKRENVTERVLEELRQYCPSPAPTVKEEVVTQGPGTQQGQDGGDSYLAGLRLRLVGCCPWQSASVTREALWGRGIPSLALQEPHLIEMSGCWALDPVKVKLTDMEKTDEERGWWLKLMFILEEVVRVQPQLHKVSLLG